MMPKLDGQVPTIKFIAFAIDLSGTALARATIWPRRMPRRQSERHGNTRSSAG